MRRALEFPKRINVELTNHCNQRCRLCPRLGFTRPLGFMEPEVFRRVAAECAAHDTALWLHFLGESLLHPRLAELIGYARDAGVRQVGLSTNGVCLHGDLAERLLSAGLHRLECSMDASDRANYLAMRGRDHFERVTRNVEGFLALKRERNLEEPVVSIQFMRTAEVEADLEGLVDRWRPHLGAKDFIMTIQPAPFSGAIAVDVPEPAGGRPPCPWLFESLMVLQDGTVTMCGADWDAQEPLGSVADSSLEAIWTGPEMTRRRNAHLQGRHQSVKSCADCQDWRLADGSGYVNILADQDATRGT